MNEDLSTELAGASEDTQACIPELNGVHHRPAKQSTAMRVGRQSYYLSKHTFACLADNHLVFLDLRNDEYLCLGRTHSNAILPLLNRPRIVKEGEANTCLCDGDDSIVNSVLHALLKKELLVDRISAGKVLTVSVAGAPTTSLTTSRDKQRVGIASAHIWNFFAATAAASINLRWKSIMRTAEEVQNRKAVRGANTSTVDDDTIENLVDIFEKLRPLYPRPYLCMFDSLALVHFLARYGVFPQWVFAVKLEPFAAHCWVQTGDLLLNDTIDNVRDYTPIMSI